MMRRLLSFRVVTLIAAATIAPAVAALELASTTGTAATTASSAPSQQLTAARPLPTASQKHVAHTRTAKHLPPNRLPMFVSHHLAKPGGRVSFMVRVILNGKPAAGRPVQLTLVHAPGPGARIAPATGITNRSGALRGVIVLSKKPGTTIFAASSGTLTNQLSIKSSSASPPPSGAALPFGLGRGSPVSAWLSTAGLALVLFGILVNINVLVRAIVAGIVWVSTRVWRLLPMGRHAT